MNNRIGNILWSTLKGAISLALAIISFFPILVIFDFFMNKIDLGLPYREKFIFVFGALFLCLITSYKIMVFWLDLLNIDNQCPIKDKKEGGKNGNKDE